MLKKILNNPYIVGGVLVFFILMGVFLFGVNLSFGESLFGSTVLTMVGMVVLWWQDFLPF